LHKIIVVSEKKDLKGEIKIEKEKVKSRGFLILINHILF
jgi:hypothetical protein